MPTSRLPIGIFTTDDQLVVRSWDQWMAESTGIQSADARGRRLASLYPELEERGLLPLLQAVLSRGAPHVLAPALHRYLIPCAPLHPSPTFDRMQQYVTIGPLRDEGRIIGLVVTVEDVTARLEREREAGELLRGTAASGGRNVDPASRQMESLARLLADEDWFVRRTAVATLAEQGQAIVSTLVDALRHQHGNLNVLSSALDLLAMSDIDVVEPLIACLDDDDPDLRLHAAMILGERDDGRAVPRLIRALDDPDSNVRFHAIEALGRLRAAEACEPLVAIAEAREFFLAFPAIQALARLGTCNVALRLVPLLADDLLRTPVVDLLGEVGDEDVTGPLVDLLHTAGAPTEVIADALCCVHERYESRYGAGDHIAELVRRRITPTGTQQLLDAVQRAGAEHMAGLARVLGWLRGESVQRALTRLLGHGSVRAQVVEALVRNGAGVVMLLVEQLRAEDLETRQAAAVALGRIGDRRATAPLVGALDDPALAVPAAGALARIGDAGAFDALMARLRDPDPAVRQAVIAALNSIGHPRMPERIAAMLDDPDAAARESALRIAGYFGYAECLDLVLARAADDTESVRRTAVEQLPFFEGPRVAPRLFAALEDPAPSVRRAAAVSLTRLDDPSRIDALLRALDDDDGWVRYAAVKALGTTGAWSALEPVVRRLAEDPAPFVRLAAVDAVGRLGPPDALEILEPLTRSADSDLARAAIAALAHVSGARALEVLERSARAPAVLDRLAAVDAIAQRREPRVPDILQWVAAAESDPAVADHAIAALAAVALRDEHQAAAATRALVSLSAEPRRRSSAVAALGGLPVRRLADVAAGLSHPAAEVRHSTIEALGRMRHVDASRAIERALDDADPGIRLAAMTELKHLGARASERKLLALARQDPDPRVREAAVMVIARAGAASEAEGPR